MSGHGDLTGRVVLVTGGARGIGAATARRLVARGARVSLVGLEPERLAELTGELGPDAIWVHADVTDQAAVEAAVAATVDRFGGIDAVLANAGVASYGTVRVADPDAFARTVDINLTGVYRCVHAAIPHLVERRGYVLIVASVASIAPLPSAASYTASKAGVEALANTLRIELAPSGVAVGCAHPSWIDTDMVRNAENALPTFRELRASLPWPIRATTSVDACAEALTTAIARRKRRVFVPRTIRALATLRVALTSRTAERVVVRRAGAMFPQIDEEAVRHNAQRSPVQRVAP